MKSDPISLGEAQAIAESIVGPVNWTGESGHISCPGIQAHTTSNAATDCTVVCQKQNELPPGIYCYHNSCRAEVAALSFRLRSALGRRQKFCGPYQTGAIVTRPKVARKPNSIFDPGILEKLANSKQSATLISPGWLAERSRTQVDNRTPASFLHELYMPGENVLVFDVLQSQGHLWTHRGFPYDARELDHFRKGRGGGVWFLNNPVTGDWALNDSRNLSRRSRQNVTAWRYMVLESDKARADHWLSALVQLPIATVAIYTSGGRSIHALVKLDARSKLEWDERVRAVTAGLVILGADAGALTALRLTRLPCCNRAGTGAMQTLLYLNAQADDTPISELGVMP